MVTLFGSINHVMNYFLQRIMNIDIVKLFIHLVGFTLQHLILLIVKLGSGELWHASLVGVSASLYNF